MDGDDTPSNGLVKRTKTAEEYIYYPPRLSIRVDDWDWQRLKRNISNIPRREAHFRDVAFSALGIGVTSLLSAISAGLLTQPLNWNYAIHLIIGLIALSAAGSFFYFDRTMEKTASRSVEEVLHDMDDVRNRSVRTEEKTTNHI